jgi:DNA-binding PadR family transcriptional regulator
MLPGMTTFRVTDNVALILHTLAAKPDKWQTTTEIVKAHGVNEVTGRGVLNKLVVAGWANVKVGERIRHQPPSYYRLTTAGLKKAQQELEQWKIETTS